jgi:signal transduction histidine kinase
VEATREVAQGNFDIRATVGIQDELGELALGFNRMTESLKRSESELREHNATLELRVKERTENLSTAIQDLKQAQQQLVQAGKMAVLGQTIAGIAHDINTPLGVIKSSIEHVNAVMQRAVPALPPFLAELDDSARTDFQTLIKRVEYGPKSLSTREERAQRKGLLAELNNFSDKNCSSHDDRIADLLIACGIYTIDPVVERIVRHEHGSKILRMATDLCGILHGGHAIETAVQRASKVVFALKTYGRIDSDPVLQPINIVDDIEIVITLYHNLMRQGVELVREYQALPEISGYQDALSQVWMNLIQNALQAMNFKGRLTIRTFTEGDLVVVTFNDTGPGIDEIVRDHIFEPFYTTKPPGEGSGLGLDIVSRIVAEHHGKINFTSQPGDTTFTVSLPVIRPGE